MISLSVWFFVAIKLYYESSDRATLSGYPVVFSGLNATAPFALVEARGVEPLSEKLS